MISSHKNGFTLIELALAMSFVSLLLIAVATLSIQLTNQYSRGLTMKEVAQSGTEASNDIKRTMAQSQLGSRGIEVRTIDQGGWVLCTGSYSYVANSSANLASNTNVIRVGGTTKVPARLAKVKDSTNAYCNAGGANVLNNVSTKDITQNDVTELLGGGSRQLVVRDLSITAKPTSGPFLDEFNLGRGIYTVRLTIGTGEDSELTTNAVTNSTTCRAPSDTASNEEFCAIDTFEFTTRVGSTNN